MPLIKIFLNYSQSKCFFFGPISSSVVALHTDLARPCPARLCFAAKRRSLMVCPAIDILNWFLFNSRTIQSQKTFPNTSLRFTSNVNFLIFLFRTFINEFLIFSKVIQFFCKILPSSLLFFLKLKNFWLFLSIALATIDQSRAS